MGKPNGDGGCYLPSRPSYTEVGYRIIKTLTYNKMMQILNAERMDLADDIASKPFEQRITYARNIIMNDLNIHKIFKDYIQ